jgi:type III pantothenate kinase
MDELRVKVSHLFAMDGVSFDVHSVVISSVVPALTEVVVKAAEKLLPNVPLHVVSHKSPFSFRIEARPANGVGADRLINAEAALRDYGPAAIIVDSGTATTVCALAPAADGIPCYWGGAIMPGLELSRDTLASRTAKLFAVELQAPQHAIGFDTTTAIQSGLMYGYAAMVDGLVARFREELRERTGHQHIPVIGTGGVTARLRSITKSIEHYDPELTLRGMAYLHASLSRL